RKLVWVEGRPAAPLPGSRSRAFALSVRILRIHPPLFRGAGFMLTGERRGTRAPNVNAPPNWNPPSNLFLKENSLRCRIWNSNMSASNLFGGNGSHGRYHHLPT